MRPLLGLMRVALSRPNHTTAQYPCSLRLEGLATIWESGRWVVRMKDTEGGSGLYTGTRLVYTSIVGELDACVKGLLRAM